MPHANQNHRESVAGEIERLSSRSENRRCLRAMPQFHVDMELPDHMRALLAVLERSTEKSREAGGR